MDITPLIPKQSKVVQSYGSDGFKISGDVFLDGIILTAENVDSWSVKKCDDLRIAHFDFIKDLPEMPEVLIVGTGEAMQFLPHDIRAYLKEEFSLIPEMMDTGAACRTYNVLLSEGRHVCAALLPYS